MSRPPAGRCTERSRYIREEYEFLRSMESTDVEIAEALGIKRTSLRDILRRQDREAAR